jgi:hypothetical protein
MLEVTMRLFATFHANENDVPLLEMASSAVPSRFRLEFV